MMDYIAIGQRIRNIRKSRMLSQEQLAEKIDISVTHMSHIETGNTKLSLPVLVALASVLDVSIDELVYDKKKNSNTDLINELVKLISDCDYEKLMVINDVLRVLVKSLNRNL